MGILEKIAEIEREIARTQKNKGELHCKWQRTPAQTTRRHESQCWQISIGI